AGNSVCSPAAASGVTDCGSSVGDLLHRWQDERADADGAIDRTDHRAQRGRDDVRVEPDAVYGTVGTDAQLHIRNRCGILAAARGVLVIVEHVHVEPSPGTQRVDERVDRAVAGARAFPWHA